MEKFKKVIAFIALFAAVVGGIGGFGYCIYIGQPVIAACIIILAALAGPQVVKIWKYLTN